MLPVTVNMYRPAIPKIIFPVRMYRSSCRPGSAVYPSRKKQSSFSLKSGCFPVLSPLLYGEKSLDRKEQTEAEDGTEVCRPAGRIKGKGRLRRSRSAPARRQSDPLG